jgi:hypothetical protein
MDGGTRASEVECTVKFSFSALALGEERPGWVSRRPCPSWFCVASMILTSFCGRSGSFDSGNCDFAHGIGIGIGMTS